MNKSFTGRSCLTKKNHCTKYEARCFGVRARLWQVAGVQYQGKSYGNVTMPSKTQQYAAEDEAPRGKRSATTTFQNIVTQLYNKRAGVWELVAKRSPAAETLENAKP